MKYSHACSFFALVCSAAISAGVHAESYVIGVEDSAFAPHYSLDKQGQYQGFARDLFDLFAESSGVQLSFKALPVNQLLPALLAGEVDLKYPDNQAWAPQQKAGKTLHYSQDIVDYVDGVLVAPQRQGQPIERLQQLSIVHGWTPGGYEERIAAKQIDLHYSDDLRLMIRQALKKETDGAYYNVVVAAYYLDNIRARPGALVFDPSLPHNRGSFHLSTVKQPQLLARFDRFLAEQQPQIAALKARYGVEENLDSQYIGLEQWKVDFLKRQKAKNGDKP